MVQGGVGSSPTGIAAENRIIFANNVPYYFIWKKHTLRKDHKLGAELSVKWIIAIKQPITYNTGCSSEAERWSWAPEAGISTFPTLTNNGTV